MSQINIVQSLNENVTQGCQMTGNANRAPNEVKLVVHLHIILPCTILVFWLAVYAKKILTRAAKLKSLAHLLASTKSPLHNQLCTDQFETSTSPGEGGGTTTSSPWHFKLTCSPPTKGLARQARQVSKIITITLKSIYSSQQKEDSHWPGSQFFILLYAS